MTASALLDSLKAHGVTVASNGDRLKLAAPPGVLKPRVLDLARRHKAELLQLLDLENRSREYSEPCHTVPPPHSDLIDEITGNAAPCVSCGAHCGTAALCGFCCREATV
jgi:hypothetical protein